MEDLKIALEKLLPKTSSKRDRVLSQFVTTIFSEEHEIPKKPFILLRKWRWAVATAAVLGVIAIYGSLKSRGLIHPEKWFVRFQENVPNYGSGDSGHLKLVVYPWAKIYVDGKYVITTPTADPIDLAPGKHRLRFIHSKFGSKTMEIDLKPGEERLIVVKMGS